MWNNIKSLHVETSSFCNASCVQCGRNQNGGPINDKLIPSNLSLDIFKKTISQMQLETITFCGNYGDPIANPHLIEQVKITRELFPDCWIGVHTNGSIRNENWWEELAQSIGNRGAVIFGIDGLKDTLPIYRRNCDFDKVIENAKTVIKNNCEARWAFIVFKHNQHQIETARNLSIDLGFEKFIIKNTHRFSEDKFPIFDNEKNTIGYLELPTIKLPNNFKEREFSCQSLDKQELYLDSWNRIFPCCWMGLSLDKRFSFTNEELQELNVENNSIEQIVNGNVFKKIQKQFSISEICQKYCGKRVFERQFIGDNNATK
jgi:hypothetical protein